MSRSGCGKAERRKRWLIDCAIAVSSVLALQQGERLFRLGSCGPGRPAGAWPITVAEIDRKRSGFFSCAAGRMRVYFRQSGRGMFAPACGFRAARRLSSLVPTDSRAEVNPLTPRGDRRRGVGWEATHGRCDLSLRCMNRPTKNCGLRRQQPGRPRDHGSPLRREERSQKRCVRQLF